MGGPGRQALYPNSGSQQGRHSATGWPEALPAAARSHRSRSALAIFSTHLLPSSLLQDPQRRISESLSGGDAGHVVERVVEGAHQETTTLPQPAPCLSPPRQIFNAFRTCFKILCDLLFGEEEQTTRLLGGNNSSVVSFYPFVSSAPWTPLPFRPHCGLFLRHLCHLPLQHGSLV